MTIHPQESAHLELAMLPTPVVELKQLARHAGVAPILMKRNDLTGVEVSGNKFRKLEYVVADALSRGADTLVTYGSFQSNHCRATAAIGARLGLRVRMILRSDNPIPRRSTRFDCWAERKASSSIPVAHPKRCPY